MTDRDVAQARGDTTPRRQELAAARRAVAKSHHPDHGGDPDTFIRALAEVEASFATDAANQSQLLMIHRGLASHGARVRLVRRRLIQRVRTALPRSVPGARRYGRI